MDLHSHAFKVDQDVAGRRLGGGLGFRRAVVEELDHLNKRGIEEIFKFDGDIKRGTHTALVLADRPAGDAEV